MQETPDVNVADGDAPLRRSQMIHRPAISNDYVVYLQEHELVIPQTHLPIMKPLLVLNPLFE